MIFEDIVWPCLGSFRPGSDNFREAAGTMNFWRTIWMSTQWICFQTCSCTHLCPKPLAFTILRHTGSLSTALSRHWLGPSKHRDSDNSIFLVCTVMLPRDTAVAKAIRAQKALIVLKLHTQTTAASTCSSTTEYNVKILTFCNKNVQTSSIINL